jgi:hypothetical protein
METVQKILFFVQVVIYFDHGFRSRFLCRNESIFGLTNPQKVLAQIPKFVGEITTFAA